MPRIVIAWATAVTTWTRASHHPARTIHTTLSTTAPAPAPGLGTTARPNGHRAYRAIRNDATPRGIVTIRTQRTTPASV